MTSKCIVLLLAAASCVSGLDIDCSDPANQPRCKQRAGTAALPAGHTMANSVKGVVAAMDKLTGASGQNPQTLSQLQQSHVDVEFVGTVMASTQAEIDWVAKSLVVQAQKYAAQQFGMAKVFGNNASLAVQTMRELAKADNTLQSTATSQQVIQSIEVLQRMRSQLEAGQFNTVAPKLQLLHQSQLLAQTLNIAIRPQAEEPSDTADFLSFLQTSDSIVDKSTQLLDQMIEMLHAIQTMNREAAASSRDLHEASMEQVQKQMEATVASMQWMQTDGIEAVGQSRLLRSYVRDVTGIQYQSLQWYSLVNQVVNASAELMDASNQIAAAATPLFDQLVHYLTEGDTPFTRMTTSALNCTTRMDACGVCGGTNLTCVGCDGAAPSSHVVDVCGACVLPGAPSQCAYFCDGVPDSGKVPDMCGVCGGDDQSCVGCDGVILSGTVYDRCGVCGGDGTSCAKAKACSNVQCSGAVQCGSGLTVTWSGYKGCCFNPSVDCVPS